MSDQAKLRLTITLQTSRFGGDLDDPCYATEEVELLVPYMEPKQLDLSKVLQGATEAVITKHRDAVGAAMRKKEAEAKRRHEQTSFWELRPAPQAKPSEATEEPAEVAAEPSEAVSE